MYLESRGVDPVLIHAYELGYCLTGEFAQRIIIPIRFHGEMVGFTSRTLESSVQKYKFPVGFESSRFLFNYDRAASSKYLVLMEGPFDAMKMPLCAVAVFTNRLSVFQELLVVKGAWEEVIVLFDQDATSNAYTVFKRLSQFKPCRLARLAKSKDPGEAPLVEVEEAVQGAGGIEKFFL
jgi:DNA primase